MVDISGLDKAEVLTALFNGSQQLGLGFLQREGSIPMTVGEAQTYIDAGIVKFDYLKGRVMKIDISGPFVEERLYDRDNGEGAVQRVIDSLKIKEKSNE
jgi:hypothetical protein